MTKKIPLSIVLFFLLGVRFINNAYADDFVSSDRLAGDWLHSEKVGDNEVDIAIHLHSNFNAEMDLILYNNIAGHKIVYDKQYLSGTWLLRQTSIFFSLSGVTPTKQINYETLVVEISDSVLKLRDVKTGKLMEYTKIKTPIK